MTSQTLIPEKQLDLPHRGADSVARATTHWIEAVTHLDPRYGGMSSIVPALAAELCARGDATAELAAFCSPDENPHSSERPVRVSAWPTSRATWLRDSSLANRFRRLVQHADGVHLHGLWEVSSFVGSHAARRLAKPYIVSAHGMLEPWAMQQKAIKKRIYSALVERKTLNKAICLHALTQAEAQDYRRFGCRQPIAIIPNAVRRPAGTDERAFLHAYPELRGRRVLLFLGRLHFKKGLDILLRAWSEISGDYPDAILVLAGPATPEAQQRIDAMIAALHLAPRVVITGMVSRDLAWSALSAAHCFLLPSYSEGLSVATLEALAVGVPVITTQQCHVPEIATHGAGWEIPATHAALAKAMRESLDSSTRQHANKKLCAQALAEEKFSWQVVSAQMADLYRWSVSGTPMPTVTLLEARP